MRKTIGALVGAACLVGALSACQPETATPAAPVSTVYPTTTAWPVDDAAREAALASMAKDQAKADRAAARAEAKAERDAAKAAAAAEPRVRSDGTYVCPCNAMQADINAALAHCATLTSRWPQYCSDYGGNYPWHSSSG